MTATGQNFELFAGDRKDIEILITNSAGNAVDLTPYMISGGIVWVMYHPTTKQIVLTKEFGSGISVPTPSNGIAVISLLPADTVDVTPKLYNHECEINGSPTEVATVTTGTVNLLYSRA